MDCEGWEQSFVNMQKVFFFFNVQINNNTASNRTEQNLLINPFALQYIELSTIHKHIPDI